MLLGRPGGAGKIETANDLGRYVVNFWRAVTAAPDEVAAWADWPVNEADLHARHVWLVEHGPELRRRMHTDPYFYDVQIAGWWVWGICQWIGGGWCAEPGAPSQKVPKLDGIGKGVHSQTAHPSEQLPKLSVFDGADAIGGVHAPRLWQKRPSLANGGTGINGALARKRPVMGGTNPGRGVHSSARRPQLSSAGQGIHIPSLGNDRGLNGVAAAPCVEWFRDLQQRLRRVRFACGDWKRVLGPSVLGKGKNVGGRRPCAVFLDPPYSIEMRDKGLYADDAEGISDEVRDWALKHGDDPDLRNRALRLRRRARDAGLDRVLVEGGARVRQRRQREPAARADLVLAALPLDRGAAELVRGARMKLPNGRRRHKVHPFLDFCASCGVTPVPRDSDCPQRMSPARKARLVSFLLDHGFELDPEHPGHIRRRSFGRDVQ